MDLQLSSSAEGRSENMVMDKLIHDLLRKQVLLPYLEKSGDEVIPPPTLFPPPLSSDETTENAEIDSKSEKVKFKNSYYSYLCKIYGTIISIYVTKNSFLNFCKWIRESK